MLQISSISQGLTDIIAKSLPTDDDMKEKIEYGLYMIISESLKLSLVAVISIFLGVFHYAAFSILVFGIYRAFLGGVHAKTHLGCLLSYSALLFTIIYTSINIEIFNRLIYLLVYPFCFLVAWRYAPADIEEKPVHSKKQRRYLRIGGFIYLTAVFGASFCLPHPFANILIATSIIECITMLPIVYRITGKKNSMMEV